MHLIVFPFIIYSIMGSIFLLFFPGRGLSNRNFWIMIGASMIGLAVGLIFVLVFNALLNTSLIFYLSFFIFPCAFAIGFVHKFGNSGKMVINKNSVLYNQSILVLVNFAVASIVTGLLALPVAIWFYGFSSLEEIAGGFIIASTAFYIIIVLYSGFVSSLNYSNATKISTISGGIIFLGSFILGPYFIIALPVVAYVALVPFVCAFLLARQNINLTNTPTS